MSKRKSGIGKNFGSPEDDFLENVDKNMQNGEAESSEAAKETADTGEEGKIDEQIASAEMKEQIKERYRDYVNRENPAEITENEDAIDEHVTAELLKDENFHQLEKDKQRELQGRFPHLFEGKVKKLDNHPQVEGHGRAAKRDGPPETPPAPEREAAE